MIIPLLLTASCSKTEYCDPGDCPKEEDLFFSDSLNETWFDSRESLMGTATFMSSTSGSSGTFNVEDSRVYHLRYACYSCPGYFVYKHFHGSFLEYSTDGSKVTISVTPVENEGPDEIEVLFSVVRPRGSWDNIVSQRMELNKLVAMDSLTMDGQTFYEVYTFGDEAMVWLTKTNGLIGFKVYEDGDVFVLQ